MCLNRIFETEISVSRGLYWHALEILTPTSEDARRLMTRSTLFRRNSEGRWDSSIMIVVLESLRDRIKKSKRNRRCQFLVQEIQLCELLRKKSNRASFYINFRSSCLTKTYPSSAKGESLRNRDTCGAVPCRQPVPILNLGIGDISFASRFASRTQQRPQQTEAPRQPLRQSLEGQHGVL